MKPILRYLAAVIGAAMLLVVSPAGTAVAADPYIGKTYAQALERISGWGGRAAIASVVGSQLSLDDCIVTSWQFVRPLDAMGRNRGGTVQLNLTCNATLATPGHPGNSVATPEGRKAKAQVVKDQNTAASLNKNPAWCQKSDPNLQYCVKFCARTGLCEFEI